MAVVLFREESWEGDGLSIDGRVFGDGLWETTRNDFRTEVGRCRISSAVTQVSVARDSTFDHRDFTRVSVDVQGDNLGLCVRMVDASNYYLGYRAGTGLFLYRVVGGVTTYIGSGSIPSGGGIGDIFSIEADGTTIRLLWDGAERLSVVDATHALGTWGIRGVSPGQYFGDVTVYVDSSTIPTTIAPTTLPPTTAVPTSFVPTTAAPTTEVPTTLASTTETPTTITPGLPGGPTDGQMLYYDEGNPDSWSLVDPNVEVERKFLSQEGDGADASPPGWEALRSEDIPPVQFIESGLIADRPVTSTVGRIYHAKDQRKTYIWKE